MSIPFCRRPVLALLVAGMGLLLTQCASSPERKEKEGRATLAHRLSREWLQLAKMVPVAEGAVYYQGDSELGPIMPVMGWAGTVTGEVLIVRADSVTAATGAVIDPEGKVEVQGEEYTSTQTPDEWKHLLPQS